MWEEIRELAKRIEENAQLIEEYGEQTGTYYVVDILNDIQKEIVEIQMEIASIKSAKES